MPGRGARSDHRVLQRRVPHAHRRPRSLRRVPGVLGRALLLFVRT